MSFLDKLIQHISGDTSSGSIVETEVVLINMDTVTEAELSRLPTSVADHIRKLLVYKNKRISCWCPNCGKDGFTSMLSMDWPLTVQKIVGPCADTCMKPNNPMRFFDEQGTELFVSTNINPTKH